MQADYCTSCVKWGNILGFYISKDQFLDLAERLRLTFESSITPLVAVKLSENGRSTKEKYFGTGTYFTYLGFPFILTAQHVVENSSGFSTFFHGTKSGATPFPLRSLWVGAGSAADIAIWGCFQSTLDNANIMPLPYKELLVSSYAHTGAYYLCNGYPGSLKTDLPYMRETMFSGNPIIGRQTDLPIGAGFDESIHFAIEYPSNVPPSGMSGSPIWNLRIHCMSNFDSWSPEAVTFAGIAHRWHESTNKLIATRVEFIRDFIPNAILHLRSKYNWIDGDKSQGEGN